MEEARAKAEAETSGDPRRRLEGHRVVVHHALNETRMQQGVPLQSLRFRPRRAIDMHFQRLVPAAVAIARTGGQRHH